MLILRLALIVGVLLLVAIFFNQNTDAKVALHFMGMASGSISVPIALLVAFLSGVVIGGILGAPGQLRLWLALRRERKESARVREEADALRDRDAEIEA